MEALGAFHELAPSLRWVGQGVLVGALALTALLERVQIGLRAAETSRWWASNGRDVLNGFALGALWLALRAGGFSGPIALAAAGAMVLAASLVQSERMRAKALPAWASFAATLALGAPAVVAPAAVHAALRFAIEALF